ncbi:MAG: c-type cytochrome [Acidobacteriota bacterium]|nr:c-type cytochrome [Acidobacteriota bacterium]
MPRRISLTLTALAVAALTLPWALPVGATRLTQATQAIPAGSGLFSTYCVVCHGADAKGTGPLADSLKRRPADLTALAKSNGGTFPRDMVARIIDGRDPVRGHGGGDMPVWGDAFGRSADAGPQAVKDRIDALVEYIDSLQAK